MTLFTLFLILFLIMDPLGNIGPYLRLVNTLPETRQRWIILREMVFALLLMLLFHEIGEWLFAALHMSEVALRIASGLILFLAALKILFPTEDSPRSQLPEGEPFLIPLAVPFIAGPPLLATIMLYAHLETSRPLMLSAIFFAWVAATAVFLAARPLQRILGHNGLIACERLMGMVLIILGIQRFAEGLQLFLTGRCD